MNRKEIENKLGFTRKEIRYLEDIGIIHNADKVKGKEYEYSYTDIKRFYLVRFFKDCGYKANDIKDVFLKYDDEKKLIEESISKMKNQIKKLNDNLKLAKTMRKNKIISFSDYSLMVNRLSQNYNEVSLSYILMTEMNNLVEKDMCSFNTDNIIDNILKATLNDVSKLDDMLIEYNYTENERFNTAILIFNKIVEVFGFYSDQATFESIKVLSLIVGLSEKTIPYLVDSYPKYFSLYKEKTIEYKIECAEIDLMITLNDYSYKDDIVQDKVANYINLYRKIIKEEYLVKIMVSVFNRPEIIGVIMNSLKTNENEAKKICDNFFKAIEYYEKQSIH